MTVFGVIKLEILVGNILYNPSIQGGEPLAASEKKRMFGVYELRGHLRREGNYIEVFKAFDTQAEETLEIRILKIPEDKSQDGLSERFGHEISLLARVDHPSIVRVIDVGAEQGYPFYTVPLVKNVMLSKYTEDNGGSLGLDEVLKFGEILTDALAVLHEKGILHRGISLKTVFVDTTQEVPYFGECSVMKDIRAKFGLSERGVPSLALYTNAPEMLTMDKWSEQTDVYQMCSLMYRLLTGNIALPATIPEKYHSVYADIVDIKSPGDVLACHGDLVGLDTVLVKGLQFSPADRYESAVQLRDALRSVARKRNLKLLLREEVAKAASVAHVRPKESAEERKERRKTAKREKAEPKPVTKERPYLWLGVAAAALFLLAGFFIGNFSGQGSPSLRPTKRPTKGNLVNVGTKPKMAHSGEKARELVEVFEKTKSEESSDQRFRAQWTALDNWVKTLKKPVDGVGTHVALLRLRMRYSRGDKKAVRELETMVDRAVQHIRGDS